MQPVNTMSLGTAAEATRSSPSSPYKDQAKPRLTAGNTAPFRRRRRYYPNSKVWCRFPDYSYLPAHPFFVLSQGLKFERFANDVQSINGKYVTRSEMEELWNKRVRRAFESSELPGTEEAERELLLKDALDQTKGYPGFDSKQYWDLSDMMNSVGSLSVAREVENKIVVKAPGSTVTDRRAKKLTARRQADAETSALGFENMQI
ncbi:unnamed protein product [Diplocarpon coronariae]